jgi:hypothetical protein
MIVAHGGHWYHAVLYLAPVLVVVIGLWLSTLRERRERGSQDRPDPR